MYNARADNGDLLRDFGRRPILNPEPAGRTNVRGLRITAIALGHKADVVPAGRWEGSIAEALKMPSGARFYRCALQVNPYSYLGLNKKKTSFTDEGQYNDAIVEACKRNAIEVIAVTDHYRVKTARSLAKAASEAGIIVFPGFEAVSKEGVHLLCLFDPGTPDEQMERYLGACGVHADKDASPTR